MRSEDQLDFQPWTFRPSARILWIITISYLVVLFLSADLLISVRNLLGLPPGVFVPVWRVLVVCGGCVLLWHHLLRLTTFCVLKDEVIEFNRGVFNRSSSYTKLASITNVLEKASLLKRFVGLVDLYIFTASTDTYEVFVPSVARSDFHRFRTVLEKKKKMVEKSKKS